MIGVVESTVGFVAKMVGREVAGLAIGPCGHIHHTTAIICTATAGQMTRVSVQRTSSRRSLVGAELNRRPSLCVPLVNDQLIPVTETGGRCSTCGTPVGWRVSPGGIIILGSLATQWGQICTGGKEIKKTKQKKNKTSAGWKKRPLNYVCPQTHICWSLLEIPWKLLRCLVTYMMPC